MKIGRIIQDDFDMQKLEELLERLYPEYSNQVIEAVENTFDDAGPICVENKDWYKKLQMYVTYADSFWKRGQSDFRVLSEQLPYIKQLGCNTVHVLPFLSSPMVDLGFDVSDYYLVREELGGSTAFDEFMDRANRENIRVLIDMVLNHISQEHRWFLQAQSGDSFYRDFFVTARKKPELMDRFTDENGVWAVYKFGDKTVKARVIFPEQAGELPHWRQGKDGIWYYHTFYPHQLDIDWTNYHVFVAFSKILAYWAKQGVSFRLDAVPFVGKDVKRGQIESSERTHLIVQAMNLIVKQVNEGSMFLVEANQPTEVVKRYFGNAEWVESELAYNFPLMNALWISVLTYNVDSLWRCLTIETVVPEHGAWVTFLRNHDELSLEFAQPKERELIVAKLQTRGLLFREGFGVSGRTASFLRENSDRLTAVHLLLASLPGNPAIIYGDEIAKVNEPDFMHKQTEWKRQRFGDEGIADDTRDINRGSIDVDTEWDTPEAKWVYERLSKIFSTRLEYVSFFVKTGRRIEGLPDWIFGCEYLIGNDKLVCLVNLKEDEVELSGDFDGEEVLRVGKVKKKERRMVLEGFGGVWIKT